jgi:SOS response regulatory protein OraA/RecX
MVSTTIDTTGILLEELDRRTENGLLPIEIARRGAALISDDVTKLLIERNQEHYSAAQWRSALREVFRRLTDDRGDVAKRSPNIAHRKDQMNTPIGRDLLDIRARQILTARGIYDETMEQYSEALDEAQVELAPAEDATAAYAGSDSGDELHLAAMSILKDRGRDWSYDGSEYMDAIDEAARILTIDLSGRGTLTGKVQR